MISLTWAWCCCYWHWHVTRGGSLRRVPAPVLPRSVSRDRVTCGYWALVTRVHNRAANKGPRSFHNHCPSRVPQNFCVSNPILCLLTMVWRLFSIDSWMWKCFQPALVGAFSVIVKLQTTRKFVSSCRWHGRNDCWQCNITILVST